ncbi:hypothetical protein EV360DRAFT_76242 [Lentinula raphanica]|nr:hypothetical protein EV360DRAFT_76242 [Lentinula raphanica]
MKGDILQLHAKSNGHVLYKAPIVKIRPLHACTQNGRIIVKSMLQPLYAIGKQLYRYTGAHLLGHVIITDHDVEGKRQSFSWGMKEMKQRGVDPKLAELVVTCSKKAGKSGRDRNCKAIRAIFSYDVKRILNEDPKNDLTPMQFVRNAYWYHVRIINWPVDIPFFKAGVESIHKITSPDLCKVALPPAEAVRSMHNNRTNVPRCYV